MTVMNAVGLSVGGILFVTTILTNDWLDGTYKAIPKAQELKQLKDAFRTKSNGSDVKLTVEVILNIRYSLQELCVERRLECSQLPKELIRLKANVSRVLQSLTKKVCFDYQDTNHFKEYATSDIKRFQQVFVYVAVTLGLIGTSIAASLLNIILKRSIQKKILKYSAITLCLFAGISGMIAILVTRIERQSESHQRKNADWKYGDSFVFMCTGQTILLLLLLYNGLQYYLHTRRTIEQQQPINCHITNSPQPSEECLPMVAYEYVGTEDSNNLIGGDEENGFDRKGDIATDRM